MGANSPQQMDSFARNNAVVWSHPLFGQDTTSVEKVAPYWDLGWGFLGMVGLALPSTLLTSCGLWDCHPWMNDTMGGIIILLL